MEQSSVSDKLEQELEGLPVNLLERSGSKVKSANSMPFMSLNGSGMFRLPLRKTPEFLDMIKKRLSEEIARNKCQKMSTTSQQEENRRDYRANSAKARDERLKPLLFSASVLTIGDWKYISNHVGELEAKCYFAKQKVVWEILSGILKSKIEILWSEIEALKAVSADDGSGRLDIVLSKVPRFFREINPQPRKHTQWEATSDFTDGQASKCRLHVLQGSSEELKDYFQKLVQSDPQLYSLSQQPDIIIDNLYFEQRHVVDEGRNESESHLLDHMDVPCASPVPEFQDVSLAQADTLGPTNANLSVDLAIGTTGLINGEAYYCYSGTDTQLDGHNSANGVLQPNMQDHLIVQEFETSMPLGAVSHGTSESEQFISSSSGALCGCPAQADRIWEDLVSHLMSD